MTVYDFNDAAPNTFELIPDNTQARVIFHLINGDPEDDLHATKDGRARMAKLAATITDGPYAKRKIFCAYMLATNDPGDKGHKKAIEIARKRLRAIVEAARGISPSDEAPPAFAARKFKLGDLDQAECSVVIGVEQGTRGFSDKNVIKRIVPIGAKLAADGGAPTAAAKPAPTKPPQQTTAW